MNTMAAIQPILALYLSRPLCASLSLITVVAVGLMSLILLPGIGKPDHFLKTLEQRIAAAAALLGLSFAGSKYFWLSYGGVFESRLSATAFYVGYHILGGIFLGMLLCILAPRNIKTLLSVTAALLLAFSFVIVLGYYAGRLSAALIFPSLSIGLLLGVSVHCGVLFRFKKPGKVEAGSSVIEAVLAEGVREP